MKRIALLIGNCNGLEGVKRDLHSWLNFLLSPIGGAWTQHEINILMNPSKKQLLSEIEQIRSSDFDFAIVVYSGHGGYRKGTILEINNRNETISDRDLCLLAHRQISVFDCCRSFDDMREPVFENDRTFSMDSKSQVDLKKIRAAYEQRILQAIPQQIRLYACSKGETALDTEDGGLYIKALLLSAKSFPKNEKFRVVQDIHQEASLRTQENASSKRHTQHPSAEFPKCLNSKKLILSINPSQI